MDLSINLEDYKLNIRAAGVIIHDNKVLVHKNIEKNHYCIPGGRVELGEDSKETLVREIKEELGKDIEVKDYLSTIENFFTMDQKKYHEIYFLYNAEFISEGDKKINYTMNNVEGHDELVYEWIDLDELDKYNVLPVCVKNVLKNNKYPRHMVQK